MAQFSDALFDMISGIVSAATKDSDGYPERLLKRLKARFGRIFSFVDSLTNSAQ